MCGVCSHGICWVTCPCTHKTTKKSLNDHLQLFMGFSFPVNDLMFQQDNGPSDQAADDQDQIKKNSGKWNSQEIPPTLANMNPIDHLWDMRETASHTQDPVSGTTQEF